MAMTSVAVSPPPRPVALRLARDEGDADLVVARVKVANC
jgi:hypothetical protein